MEEDRVDCGLVFVDSDIHEEVDAGPEDIPYLANSCGLANDCSDWEGMVAGHGLEQMEDQLSPSSLGWAGDHNFDEEN